MPAAAAPSTNSRRAIIVASLGCGLSLPDGCCHPDRPYCSSRGDYLKHASKRTGRFAGGARVTSAEELVRDLLPFRHTVFGLLGREEVDAEIAFLRLERGVARRHVGMRRDVVGGAEDLLALLRDDEIDQELGGIGMRRALVHRDH